MLKTIRKWIFKLFFGMDLEDFILGNMKTSSVREEIDKLRDDFLRLSAVYTLVVEEMIAVKEKASNHEAAIHDLLQTAQLHQKSMLVLADIIQQQKEEL